MAPHDLANPCKSMQKFIPRDSTQAGVVMGVGLQPPIRNTMNFSIRRSVTALSLTSAILALATLTSIAQPPRGAESLTNLSPRSNADSELQRPGSMSCTRCDTKLTSTKSASRGQQIATRTAVHGCGDCTTTLTTAGHGKAKAQAAQHSCTMTTKGSGNCCGANTGTGTATKN